MHEIDETTSHSTGSDTGNSVTRLDKCLPNEERSTLSLIKTSHPVATSSPIGEMTSQRATEEVQQVETPKDETTPSTLSSIREVIRSSEPLKIEASPLLSKQETTSTVLSSHMARI